MTRLVRVFDVCMRRAALAAGLLAASAAGRVALAEPLPLSLTSFGAAQTLSAYELSASGIAARAVTEDTQPRAQSFDVAGIPVLPASYRTAMPSGFAASLAVSPTLAFDSAYNADIAARFASYDRLAAPLIDGASFLVLANGGRYAGVTFLAAADLHLRLGASARSDRLDNFSFAPRIAGGMPLLFDPSQTRSLLAGATWDFSDWASIGINAISSSRSGIPLGYPAGARIASRAETNAVGLSARFGLGNGWVTTADYAQSFSQLDQRSGGAGIQTQSYSISVAKHGLFGDDTLGFSLSRPAPGTLDGFTSLTASGDLPPLILAHGQTLAPSRPETDFQLGYVTSFLDGTLALQTNAAYQMNYQGQNGATAVSLLSRAKIKF